MTSSSFSGLAAQAPMAAAYGMPVYFVPGMPAAIAFLIMLVEAFTSMRQMLSPSFASSLPAYAPVSAIAPGSVQPVASSISLSRMRKNIVLSIYAAPCYFTAMHSISSGAPRGSFAT